MLKDNRMLIGLGIGLIIGAILLQLMNLAITGVGHDALLNDSNIDENQFTLEELKAIADSLEYNVIEKSVVLYTQDEMDEAVLHAKESVEQVPVVKETEVEAPAKKLVIGNSATYHISIESGMVTEDVTQLLITAGLISDAESFKEELTRRKLNNKIQVGTFEFSEKPSPTELINIITSPR
ncbi:MAG: hypothetical protein WD424_08100 [Paenibacillaceae bacterium]